LQREAHSQIWHPETAGTIAALFYHDDICHRLPWLFVAEEQLLRPKGGLLRKCKRRAGRLCAVASCSKAQAQPQLFSSNYFLIATLAA